jgi:TIR domain
MSEKLDSTKIDAALERAAQKSVHGTRGDRSGRFMARRAFISYSHDSPEHKSWVLKLGSDLRAIGVDVVLDQWDLAPGQDVSLFMQKGISEADRVVLVCSSAYVSKSEEGVGGVGYERLIVTTEVVQSIDTRKFIPILRGSDPTRKLPVFLGPRMYLDFENDEDYDAKLVELAREIHGAPATSEPALGLNELHPVRLTPA